MIPIVKMGTPSLRETATPVSLNLFDSNQLETWIKSLTEAMQTYGGVGIAAPQIGINQRMIVFGFNENLRYPEADPIPFTVLINPTVHILGDEKIAGWEGCLSVPGLRGNIERYRKLRYSGFDSKGRPIERTVEGFHARLIQHEVDHLDGILYVDRLKSTREFGFEDALKL